MIETLEERIDVGSIRRDRHLDALDLTIDLRTVLDQADLEILLECRRTPLALDLDPARLTVGPGLDRLQVVAGKLAHPVGFRRLTAPNFLDMGLPTPLDVLADPDPLERRRRLHRMD